MIENKEKEILVSSYIIQNSELLFHKSVKDVEVKERGKIVELWLYYLPSSKYEIWDLKKLFMHESQFIMYTMKKDMLCVKFLAPTKFADLIICKLHT